MKEINLAELSYQELKKLGDEINRKISEMEQKERDEAFDNFLRAYEKCRELGICIYYNHDDFGDIWLSDIYNFSY